MAKFTVDTHLFRELGELLVGRDSTALVELIKNAYDADATSVVIYGEALDDTDRGFIQVSDDGIGMTQQSFQEGFLRVASRAKDTGPRISRRYRRHFTGSKGIGRLAAHKLARFMAVQSIPWELDESQARYAVDASIDWDIVESHRTLDDLDGTEAIRVNISPLAASTNSGTVILLRRLRRRWTPSELGRFLVEAQTFTPSPVLIRLPPGVTQSPSLFEEPLIRDAAREDPGFSIQLEGAFSAGEDYWQNIAQSADWVIEIDALDRSGTVDYQVTPTRRTKQENPVAEPRRFSVARSEENHAPFFQARILVRQGPADSRISRWAERASGVRVFMEGFRVLPYGEPTNDWLGLDADYRRRSSSLASLRDLRLEESLPKKGRWALSILGNNSYFGAVFLTQANASSLRTLVNREGFVPEKVFDTLTDLVRKGIDLSTRVRASARYVKAGFAAAGQLTKETGSVAMSSSGTDLHPRLEDVLARARTLAGEAQQLVASGNIAAAAARVADAVQQVEVVSDIGQKRMSEHAMLSVLASVGMQLAAFIHEINALVGMAEAVEASIARIREGPALPLPARNELSRLHGDMSTLRRSLERQASYLLDIVTPDARRRRVRQSLSERFDAGARLVRHLAERRQIAIINEIPSDLKSPPMFPAELTAVFANLLTNAVKAAGTGGRIHAMAARNSDGTVTVIIENTGVEVELTLAERWFRPFESTTTEVDPVLGQGMGLGLPITRDLLAEYGAAIKFVNPQSGYSTAIQIVFPR
jgi:signal transduction histidine kinase